MILRPLKVEVRIRVSRPFPPEISELRYGTYLLKPIPAEDGNSTEAWLEFIDDPQGTSSSPRGEAEIICSILSLIFGASIDKIDFRIDSAELPERFWSPPVQDYSQLDSIEGNEHLRKVLCMPTLLAQQVIRAARAYGNSIRYISSDPTFALFLLVVSVECLSSQPEVIPISSTKNRYSERFCDFLERHTPGSRKICDDNSFHEIILKIYKVRSTFVHGGEKLSWATRIADKAGRSHFEHLVNGKTEKTPGLTWFASVVRAAILGYLESLDTSEPDNRLFARIAVDEATLRVRQ